MFTFTAKNLRFLMFIKDKLPHVEFGLPGAEEGFQPNAVGGTLLLFLPIIYVFFLSSLIKGPEGPDMGIIKRRWAVCFFGLATFIATFVLILTQSRGSWLAFMVSIGFVVLPFIRVRGPRPAVLALYFSGVAGILTIGYLSLTGTHIITLSTAEQSRALAGRTILWSFGLETIAKHPWTGIGLNQVRYYPDVGYTTAHLHNHYIHTAAEMGIPALCALLAILIGAGVLCVRTWKAAPSHWRGRSALGLGGGVLAYAVFGMMDSISIGTKPSFLFWISLALISGLFGLMQNPKSVKA
jgi:putative inorganic carbon (HCO3(-)) transporter